MALSLVLVPAATQAQPATDVELEPVSSVSGLDTTVDLQGTHVAGDDRLFAVGRHGIIQIINFDDDGNASLDPTPFLDIDTLVHSSSGEQGLLGLAFHPDYDTNGYFFVNYTCDADAPPPTDCANDGDTIVARFSVNEFDSDDADESSELVLATIPQPATNHNGGQLMFEPPRIRMTDATFSISAPATAAPVGTPRT